MKKKVFEKLSVVIPSYNEAKTFEKVLKEVGKLKEISEIIFVDDGSTDNTETKIKKFKSDPRFIYIKHTKNKGKSIALKSGIEKAKNEVILLLDADLQNITFQKIRKIINPVLYDEVDVSRAGFRLSRGRVTEIAVKPMMRILFPDVYFDQPISGQVCAKKDFLQTLNLEAKWAVDIGILLDAIQAGQRIVEIDIGELVHKARPDKDKAEMAEQVMETMIKKAGLIQHKYKLVIFTLDNTLVHKNFLQLIFTKLKLEDRFTRLEQLFQKGEIESSEFIIKSAALLKGVRLNEIKSIVDEIPLMKYAPEVINALKKQKYKVAIITSNFSAIIGPVVKKLGIEMIDSVYLEYSNDKLSGLISPLSCRKWVDPDLESAFEKAFARVVQRAKVKALETVMVANSPKCLPLFLKAGLSIAFKPEDRTLREFSDKTITILPEILAIIE